MKIRQNENVQFLVSSLRATDMLSSGSKSLILKLSVSEASTSIDQASLFVSPMSRSGPELLPPPEAALLRLPSAGIARLSRLRDLDTIKVL